MSQKDDYGVSSQVLSLLWGFLCLPGGTSLTDWEGGGRLCRLQQRGSLSLTGSEVRELRALLLLCCFDGKVSPLTSLACSGAAHAIRQGVCSNV